MDPFPVPIPLDHQPPPPHHPPPTPPQPQPQPQPQQQQQQQPPVSFPPPTPPPPPSIATATAAAAAPLPYPEIIFAAITALKEKDGSSKMAIAKYIEQNYSNLPPNHSALLTQHLKRLKNAGLLVMVKKSYKLPPRSDASAPTIVPNNHQQNALPPPPAQLVAQLPKTGRGRGRPPKSPNAVKAQPVLVSVGLVDQHPPSHQQQLTQGKRGRGRPKKIGGPAAVQKVSTGSGKRPGRPKKLKPVRANFGPNGVAQVHAQAQAEAQPISYAYSEGNVPVQHVGVPRGRGRPRKLGPGVTAAAATAKPKPVGRPAGRPVGRPKKSKSRSGRPVGRPRKTTTEAAGAQAVSTVGDLRRKLEYFQTKVKIVVDVLKPQLTGESQISAVAAIQELEGLATMDLTAPLREDAQQQPQQPPVQVQN